MENYRIKSLIKITVLAFMFGCTKDSSTNNNSNKTIVGDTKQFGADSVHTWIKTDASGSPTSIGVTFRASALSGLPVKDSMYMVMLPSISNMGGMMGGGMMSMNFDHVSIYWSANGDSAPSKYNMPHLDCQFYIINSSNQMMIMGGHDTGNLGNQYMPMNCMGDSFSMANMGVYWTDTTSKEYHGGMFDHTFMYGFYHTDMTFIGAMCSKTFLDSKASYTGDIKQPSMFGKNGYYPLKYSITYNANTMSFTYSLDNLKKQ